MNNCDGCQSNMELKEGIHYKNNKLVMYCTKKRYTMNEDEKIKDFFSYEMQNMRDIQNGDILIEVNESTSQ